MGKRQDCLVRTLESVYGTRIKKQCQPNFYSSPYDSKIFEVYKNLGGQLNRYPTPLHHWKPDIIFSNFIIELDEERHFNRFRAITLESAIYGNLPNFNMKDYKDFCIKYENECLRAASWSGNWENKSSRKQFGDSDPKGRLGEKGSSRWKQRAFYDFLKDISVLITGKPVVRVSIWEKNKTEKLLEDILRCCNNDELIQFIKPKVDSF